MPLHLVSPPPAGTALSGPSDQPDDDLAPPLLGKLAPTVLVLSIVIVAGLASFMYFGSAR
ncbi:hypothetical protein [Pseudacidovorax intermedius]|uniref:hypothetical protein n=1 Tax=Pseudacidovorax intermedius TaxID=433924 RepID=UPI00034627AD|nr:hypothetical protein [Pseudacidovorax intermedius]